MGLRRLFLIVIVGIVVALVARAKAESCAACAWLPAMSRVPADSGHS